MKNKKSESLLGGIIITDPVSRESRRFQGIPGIEVLDGGKIFVCYYAGHEPGEGPGNYVVLAVSDDTGRSWREVLSVMPPDSGIRIYDPVVWLDPAKRLWLFWAQCGSSKIGDCFDGRAGVWGAFCNSPEQPTHEWSQPRRIAEGVMMNKPTVLKNGQWVLPVALWSIYPEKLLPEFRSAARSNLLFSSDNGKNFKLKIGPDIPQRSFDEHVIVERKDGSLWLLARTQYGIGCSSSSDLGESWSEPINSGLGGPDSRFAMRRLSSGKLCLINHQVPQLLPLEKVTGKFLREKLTVWLSDDDGKSWYGRLLLDCRTNVSYPDIAESNDGFIYVVYDYERTTHGQILLSRFTEQDIIAGKLITPGAFNKLTVSALL